MLLLASILALMASVQASELSCGKLYYRTLHLDEDSSSLYVGAMDRVIKIDNLSNLTQTDCSKDSLIIEADNVAKCSSRGKSTDYDCRNHIRVIQPIGDGKRMYICGTNAHSPKDLVIYANLTHLARHEFYPGIGDGIAKCPFDPEDNSTAIWVESGNPGGHPAIYSGTNAEFTKADAVIFRGDIFDETTGRREYTFKRTIKYDSHMLDKPDFVGSYDIGDYVYFFFRETAVEYLNCGKTIYSRIARVCKRDTGGKNILHQNWATYLKARLNCSIPGEFPFFFNEIQDVFKATIDDSVFHAVFSTNQNGLQGSAICSFNLKDIEEVFEGKFKEQATSTSMWLPVPSADVPEPRPGSCIQDTRDFPDNVLNFIRKHPMMNSDVPHDSAAPVFYIRDTTLTKLVVDQEGSFTIYYAGTSNGKIYKVSRWLDANGKFKSRLLSVIDATFPDPIRAMVISRQLKSLYVTSDSTIKQIPLTNVCTSGYTNCAECVRDPHCGWNRQTNACQASRLNLVRDPRDEAKNICEALLEAKKVTANFGSAVHLVCPTSAPNSPIEWYHSHQGRTRHLQNLNGKVVFTQDQGLVIIGVGEPDNGQYECRVNHETVASYTVEVGFKRCASPEKRSDYQTAYTQWCNEFQKYREALQTWESKQSICQVSSVQKQTLFPSSNPLY